MEKFWSVCTMPIGVFFCFGPVLVAWWWEERKRSRSNEKPKPRPPRPTTSVLLPK